MKKYVLLLCLMLPAVSCAGSDDHDVAKKLKETGKIVSLEQVLANVRARQSGRILEIELKNKRDQLVYEIEMIDDEGKVHEYFYDARDGRLIWEEYGESEETPE